MNASAPLIEVHLDNFEQMVIQASAHRPVIVDFWAEWCAPCRVIAPVLEALARRYADGLIVAKLEVDAGENMKLAGRFQVRGFPTIMLIRDGEELDRFAGAKPLAAIEAFLDKNGALPQTNSAEK